MEKIHQIGPSLGKEEKRELLSVINSGWFTEAKKTREFERMFCEFVGCKYATAVTSGTSALFIALKSIGIGKGDEIIVPDLTFVATATAVEMTGAKPVLVDIEPLTLNLDLTKLQRIITNRTKAIIPVDMNGRSTNMNELKDFTKKKNLFLVEDAAHAIGSYHKGKHMGTLSDIAVFSFSIPKIITTGQGGMIITNNKQIFNKCLAVKDFGREFGKKHEIKSAFAHKTIGYNFKFTEFQAAVGIAQMKKLPRRINKKKKIFKKYRDNLSNINEIEFIPTNLENITVWSVDILTQSNSQKIKLMNYLSKKNIETRKFFPPIHRLNPFKTPPSKFKITSNVSDRGLWLPSSITLTDKQLELVSKEITEFFK